MNPITALVARHRAGSVRACIGLLGEPLRPAGLDAPGARGRRAPARRGDLEPGRPVRRVHRHDPRGLPGRGARPREAEGFPADRLVLGGDHLGRTRGRTARPPRRCRSPSTSSVPTSPPATRRSTSTAACRCRARSPADRRGRRRAGRRAARRRGVRRHRRRIDRDGIVYVIGTEVPTPGGAKETLHDLEPTPATAAVGTLDVHRAAFERAGLADVWRASSRSSCSRGGVRPPAGHRLRARGHDRAAGGHRGDARTRVRGPLDRLPDARGAPCPGRRPLGGAQGRPRPDLRAPRGAVRPRRRRGGTRPGRQRGRPAQRRRASDARGAGPLGALLRGRRARAAHRPHLQLQRPHALLLAGPGDHRRDRGARPQPRRGRHPAPAAEPVPARAVRAGPRGPAAEPCRGHRARPRPRRPASVRRRRRPRAQATGTVTTTTSKESL